MAVVGGGIVGATTALLLQRSGATTALIDAGRIGAGTTGATTAKVSALQATVYSELTRSHGPDVAAAYARANSGALSWMRQLVSEEEIACDWEDRPAVTYVTQPDRRELIEQELGAARTAGLDVEEDWSLALPFGAAAGITLPGQAQFHPRRYVLALTDAFVAAGGTVTEDARVLGVDSSGDGCVVETAGGRLRADQVVLATHYPLLDRGLFFARLKVERSYVVGVAVDAGSPKLPEGMLYADEQPSRSLRTAPLGDGRELVLVGGAGHHTGRSDTTGRYEELTAWAGRHFPGAPVVGRWSAQDPTASDGLPYAGEVPFGDGRIWTVTGLRKWGMTNGTAAAHVISAALSGETHPWQQAFGSLGTQLRRGASSLIKENATIGMRLTTDRARSRIPPRTAASLRPGEGAIVRHGARFAAGYRDESGELTLVSPACTHLGCELRFNDAERSWDCPCHASRFAVDGTVLEGPATRDLEPVDP